MAPLTEAQETVLAVLPIFPSLLSLVSSITLLSIVYRHHVKTKTTVYHRLLVGMSLCDCVVSFWFPWMAFFSDSDSRVGTTATCTFTGFLFNFAFSGVLYNALLSYYFLLTARFGWRDHEIASRVEPLMHLLAVGFPVACGVSFSIMGVYGEQEIGEGCWIVEYPRGCNAEKGECINLMLAWVSAGLPIFFSLASLMVNNSLIYWHVRTTTQKARKYAQKYQTQSTTTTKTKTPPDAQTRRLQAVAVQAGLYVVVFVLNYLWTIVLRNVAAYYDAARESELYWLMVLQAICLPLQGFFNLLVFSRPKYLQARRAYPNESRWWAFQTAMFGKARFFGTSVTTKKPSPSGATTDTTVPDNSGQKNTIQATTPTIEKEMETTLELETDDGTPQDTFLEEEENPDSTDEPCRLRPSRSSLRDVFDEEDNAGDMDQSIDLRSSSRRSVHEATPPRLPSRRFQSALHLAWASVRQVTRAPKERRNTSPYNLTAAGPEVFDSFLYGFDQEEEEEEQEEQDNGVEVEERMEVLDPSSSLHLANATEC